MRTKRTRRTGVRTLGAVAACLLAVAAAPARADKKPEPSYRVVAGTVFTESGRSLPGAEVVLEPSGAVAPELRKFKKNRRFITDARGEFAIRVPAVRQEYLLRVAAHGFEPQQKPVQVGGEDRVDVFIRLQPASK